MIIDCISDLHGDYPKLEGGDLLIVAGDLTARDLENDMALFDYWLNDQKYKKKIVIAGNHDNVLYEKSLKLDFCTYLCDSGTEFEGLKIWGSPWSLWFEGINPQCMAFVGNENLLAEKFALIPDDTDILITHTPPYGILDGKERYMAHYDWVITHLGSAALANELKRVKPKLHVFGHIHEGYGMYRPSLDFVDLPGYPIFVNASHTDESYDPINPPIRIIL